MPDFQQVVDAWDRNGRAGARAIHPLKPDDPEYWASGRDQARQVDDYAAPGAFVIDFGCGIGRLSIPLAEAGYNVLAVDASQAMLDSLAEYAVATDLEVGALRSDGSDLPDIVDHIIGQRADVIIACNVLIHHDYAGVERIVTGLSASMRTSAHLIANWPTGRPRERTNWTDVTTWTPAHRRAVAERAGLELVADTNPSVWRKTGAPDA